jgi:hypothetical protein
METRAMNLSRLFIPSIVLSFGWYFYQINDQQSYYILFAILACCATLVYQLATLYRRRAYLGFIRPPIRRSDLVYFLIIALRWSLLLITFFAARELVVKSQFTEASYRAELGTTVALFVLVGLSCLVVKKRIDYLFNACLLVAAFSLGHELYKAHNPPGIDESIVLSAPFKKPFTVINGGESRLHSVMKSRDRRSRSYLLHMIVTGEGFMQEGRDEWTDYPHTFGEPIYGLAEGVVLALKNDQPDAAHDAIHSRGGPGNFLLIEIGRGQYLLLAHLQRDSITVDVGDTIAEGQLIAACGKSGQTSEAALALGVFDSPDIFDPNTRSYPIYFRDVATAPQADPGDPHFAKRGQVFVPLDRAANP